MSFSLFFIDLDLSNEIDTDFLNEDDQEMLPFLGSRIPVDEFQEMSTLHNNAASSSIQRYREVWLGTENGTIEIGIIYIL